MILSESTSPYPPPSAAPGQPGVPDLPYAHWGYRLASFIVDSLINGIPATIGSAVINASITTTVVGDRVETSGPSTMATVTFLVLTALSVAIFVWNTCLRQGRTGQSVGKQLAGTKLISARTGQPIGGGMAFVRYICHIVDALPCYLGYLWPIWDRKRQTFADKIVGTYVIRV